MKVGKDDIPDKVQQAAVYAVASEVAAENRDLDTDEKVRSMIDDMIRDKRETRFAIQPCSAGDPASPDVNQLKPRGVVSEPTDDASEKESGSESVRKLADSRNPKRIASAEGQR